MRPIVRAEVSEGDRYLRFVGIGLLSAKAVLIPLYFDPAALVAFAQPKALLSHALSAMLVAVLFALTLRGGRPWRHWALPQFLAVAYLAVYTAAALLAIDRVVALFGAADRNLGLATAADLVVMFLAIPVLVHTSRDARQLAVALFATPLLLVAYQVVQMFGLDPLPWASGFGRDRPFATLGNAGVYAQYLGTIAPAAFALGALPGGPVAPHERRALLALGVFLGVAAVLTGTRAVLLGLAAASAAIALWYAILSGSRRIGLLLVGAVLAGGALTMGGALLTPLASRLQTALVSAPSVTNEINATPEGSVSGRLLLYEIALKQLADRPILGMGPDNFVAAFARYRPEPVPGTSLAAQTSTHSWVARAATDAGLLGLASLLALSAVCGWAAIRARRSSFAPVAAAGSIAAASFLVTGLVSINDIGTEWLLWVAFAAAAGAGATGRAAEPAAAETVPPPAGSRRRKQARAKAAPRRRAGPGWPAWAILGAVALACLLQLRALDASHAAETARQARARGAAEAAVAASRRAVELDPLRAEYWNGLGLGETRRGRFADAERAFLRAQELAPYQATYRTNLAKAQLSAADPTTRARGLETAKEAVAADPNNPDTEFTLALAFVVNGHLADAAATSERGLRLDPVPRDGTVFEVAARAYLGLGRPADAERWARQGLSRIAAGPESYDIVMLLARSLGAQGRAAEALALLQARILDIDPRNAPALELKRQFEAGSR